VAGRKRERMGGKETTISVGLLIFLYFEPCVSMRCVCANCKKGKVLKVLYANE